MSRRAREFEIEQQIFLGGQISNKHKDYMEIARLSPELGLVHLFLQKMENWTKIEDPIKLLDELIVLIGEVDFVTSCTELTKLSMVMGDTRKHYGMGGLKDAIRAAEQSSDGHPPG